MKTQLSHSVPKIDPILLILKQKPNKKARIQPDQRQLSHALAMERLELRRKVRPCVVFLHRVQAIIATAAPAPAAAHYYSTKLGADFTMVQVRTHNRRRWQTRCLPSRKR